MANSSPYEGINTPFSSISKEAGNTRPKCKDCSTSEYSVFFNRVEGFGVGNNELRWVCVECSLNIPDHEIQYDERNANAKYPGQLSPEALAKQQQKEEQQTAREQQFANSIAAAKPKLFTKSGGNSSTPPSTSSGGGGTAGSNASSYSDPTHTTFQSIGDVHKLARQKYAEESNRGWSDHTRSSIYQNPTQVHPLDRELVERGYQLRKSFELPRTAPTDKAIVEKNPRDRVRSYPRYVEDSDQDPYYHKT